MLKETKYTRKPDGKSNEYNNYVIILNGPIWKLNWMEKF